MAITKDEEIIRKGYKAYPEIITLDEETIDFMESLEDSRIFETKSVVNRMSLDDAFVDVSAFLNENFRIHDIWQSVAINQDETSILCRSPYELPLLAVDTEDAFLGSVIENLPKDPKRDIVFLGIRLCKDTTELTSLTWTHEITHTQLDSIKGAIHEFYNSEVLSTLVGNIHAFELKDDEHALRINDKRRLYELLTIACDILKREQGLYEGTREEMLLKSSYWSADIKAYSLFLIYYYGNNVIRQEMFRNIQRVFDNEISVEDLLQKYGVTDSISGVKRQLVKYYNR